MAKKRSPKDWAKRLVNFLTPNEFREFAIMIDRTDHKFSDAVAEQASKMNQRNKRNNKMSIFQKMFEYVDILESCNEYHAFGTVTLKVDMGPTFKVGDKFDSIWFDWFEGTIRFYPNAEDEFHHTYKMTNILCADEDISYPY